MGSKCVIEAKAKSISLATQMISQMGLPDENLILLGTMQDQPEQDLPGVRVPSCALAYDKVIQTYSTLLTLSKAHIVHLLACMLAGKAMRLLYG